jgi:thiol-disulfide isomerase/thioredoxin
MRSLLALPLAVMLLACSGPAEPPGNTLAALDLADHQGHWVVVNYWAKWCKPCIEEIPELNSLNERYPQVRVLGVNYDGATADDLQQQIETLGVAFPTLLAEPSAQLGVELPSVLPTTLVLDPTGKLVQTLIGPQTLESLVLATGQAATAETGKRP